MKKILTLVLMTLGSFLWAGAPMPNLPQVDPFELLNNMDPKELDKLMEDLAKMSPEEIKYYEDLGKQMFKDSGYDLDEIAKTFPAQTPSPLPPANKPDTTAKPNKPVKPNPTTDEPSKKEKDSLLRMVKALSESLASIRQKAASDETLHPHLAPLQQELDLLTAYVNRLDYERHLKHFADKEFAALKTKLRKMSSMLEEFDNNFFVPELTLRKSATTTRAGSYGTQMQEATSVLKEFKTYMTRAFSSDAIITDIENLFKKHDQEALTIKKEIEEQQKKASEQVKKLSTTNTGKFAPIPKVTNQPLKTGGAGSGSGSSSRAGGYPSAHQGSMGQQQAQRPGGLQPQQPPKAGDKAKPGAPTKPGEKGKEADAKTREKKDPEIAEVPPTPQEALEKMKRGLRSVNVEVGRNKQELNRVFDAIKAGTKPSKEDRELLESITETLSTAAEKLKKYLADLKKEQKENKEKNPALGAKSNLEHAKKVLKDSFAADLNELIEMNDKFTTLTPAAGPFTPDTQAALDDAKGLVESFKKNFIKIDEQINTRTRS